LGALRGVVCVVERYDFVGAFVALSFKGWPAKQQQHEQLPPAKVLLCLRINEWLRAFPASQVCCRQWYAVCTEHSAASVVGFSLSMQIPSLHRNLRPCLHKQQGEMPKPCLSAGLLPQQTAQNVAVVRNTHNKYPARHKQTGLSLQCDPALPGNPCKSTVHSCVSSRYSLIRLQKGKLALT
jgi:hypothetical protein